jgi:hypothetical protein
MSKHVNKATRTGGLCKCGCGQTVPQAAGAGRPRTWIDSHRPGRTATRDCACGCGMPVVRMHARGVLPKYFPGHSPSALKYPTRNKVP